MKPTMLLTLSGLMVLPALRVSFGEEGQLARAKAARAATIERLDDALAQARRAHALGVDAANRTLLAAYDAAIERARARGDQQALEALTRDRRELARTLPEPLDSLRGDAVLECVLGAYGRVIRGPRYRFVNLQPPNRDLWSAEVRRQVHGKISLEGLDYIGTAKLVIQRQGWYTVDANWGTEFRLNGTRIDTGDVELLAGVYDVEIYTNTWGQPYLQNAAVAVYRKGTKDRLPFVNTGEAIEKFLGQKIDGRRVVEVSGYRPRIVDVSVKGPRGRVPPAPEIERPVVPQNEPRS